jgi:hypothetical protein
MLLLISLADYIREDLTPSTNSSIHLTVDSNLWGRIKECRHRICINSKDLELEVIQEPLNSVNIQINIPKTDLTAELPARVLITLPIQRRLHSRQIPLIHLMDLSIIPQTTDTTTTTILQFKMGSTTRQHPP